MSGSSKSEPPPAGTVPAKAMILDVSGRAAMVAGYPMVVLTLEVQPEDEAPFRVKRKVSAGGLRGLDPGRRIDVVYDPAKPQRTELA